MESVNSIRVLIKVLLYLIMLNDDEKRMGCVVKEINKLSVNKYLNLFMDYEFYTRNVGIELKLTAECCLENIGDFNFTTEKFKKNYFI